MSARWQLVALVLWACSSWPDARVLAHTDTAITHVVRPGETLGAISELYYGDSHRDNVLIAENGLDAAALTPGMRLVIPTVRYHRVDDGDTWASLAERFYGDVRRSFVLIEANNAHINKQPEHGVQLLIPYPLRHTATTTHDPLRQAARDFYDGSTKTIAMLRRFNVTHPGKYARGDVILLPLANLQLSESGRKAAQDQGRALTEGASARAKQLTANEQLVALRQHVQEGRFVEAVSLANQLLGAGQLTGNQLVTIQRELGTALVALDREDLAFEAFKALVEQQPDIELGLSDTSPRVLRVLDRARRAVGNARTVGSRENNKAAPRKR
ncbi:MAG: hypothetical protein RL701_3848 [Pseudomonadota bacterium]